MMFRGFIFVLYFSVRIVFFFFQAEDGIRDSSVTGVQTWLFRSKSHVASEHEFTAYAADAATDFCDADDRRSRQSYERIHQDRKAGRTDRGGDVAELAGQVEVAQVKVLHRALEHDDAEARACIKTGKQALQTPIHVVVDNVEGRIVEHHSPESGSLFDHAQRRRHRSHDLNSGPTSIERAGDVILSPS